MSLASTAQRARLVEKFNRTWGTHPIGPRIVGDDIFVPAIPALALLYE